MHPEISVTADTAYAIVLKSKCSRGRYGFEYNDAAPYPDGGAAYSSDGGSTFASELHRTLLFRTFVHAVSSGGE